MICEITDSVDDPFEGYFPFSVKWLEVLVSDSCSQDVPVAGGSSSCLLAF